MIPYEFSLLIALTAVVYSYFLTRPSAMLNGLYNWLYSYFKTDERNSAGKPTHPLFMVLIHCEKCVAGQWALWLFLGLYALPCYELHGLGITLIKLGIFVAHTIFAAGTIKGIYTRYIE